MLNDAPGEGRGGALFPLERVIKSAIKHVDQGF